MHRKTEEQRFWEKVDKSGECWTWTAGTKTDGYGMFSTQSNGNLAHRFSYRLANGDIPPGMEIDHICHNRPCVRPDHLRAVSHKKNTENRKGAQSNSTSGVRGVTWNRRSKKWQARVWHYGRVISAGYFSTLEEAAVAVEAKRNEIYNNNQEAA